MPGAYVIHWFLTKKTRMPIAGRPCRTERPVLAVSSSAELESQHWGLRHEIRQTLKASQ